MPYITTGPVGGGGAAGPNHIVPHNETGAAWAWNFDGNGVENIVGGAFDLVTFLGYGAEPEGTAGILDCINATTVLTTGNTLGAVQIYGAITVACWIQRVSTIGNNTAIVGTRVSGSGEATNILWELGFEGSTNKIRSLWQASTVSQSHTSTAVTALYTWEHWTLTRNSAGTIAKLYKNGVLDSTSPTLLAPTGGTNQNQIRFGNNNSGTEFPGIMKTPIVLLSTLDDAQVLALYNSTASNGSW